MRHISFVLLLFFSVNLWSDEFKDSGFYVGGALSFSELDDDGMGDNQNFEDNSGTSRLFGGYQFSPYVSVEASIDSLGIYDGETITSDIDSSYSALTFSLLGRLPLGAGFSVFMQGGGGVGSIYQNVDGVVGAVLYDDEDYSSSGFTTVLGAGVSYLIPNHNSVEIRAGYLETDLEVDAIGINALGALAEDEYDQKIKQFYLGGAYHF